MTKNDLRDLVMTTAGTVIKRYGSQAELDAAVQLAQSSKSLNGLDVSFTGNVYDMVNKMWVATQQGMTGIYRTGTQAADYLRYEVIVPLKEEANELLYGDGIKTHFPIIDTIESTLNAMGIYVDRSISTAEDYLKQLAQDYLEYVGVTIQQVSDVLRYELGGYLYFDTDLKMYSAVSEDMITFLKDKVKTSGAPLVPVTGTVAPYANIRAANYYGLSFTGHVVGSGVLEYLDYCIDQSEKLPGYGKASVKNWLRENITDQEMINATDVAYFSWLDSSTRYVVGLSWAIKTPPTEVGVYCTLPDDPVAYNSVTGRVNSTYKIITLNVEHITGNILSSTVREASGENTYFFVTPSYSDQGSTEFTSTIQRLSSSLPGGLEQVYDFNYDAPISESMPARFTDENPYDLEVRYIPIKYPGMDGDAEDPAGEPSDTDDTSDVAERDTTTPGPISNPPRLPSPPGGGGIDYDIPTDGDTDVGMYFVYNPSKAAVNALSLQLWAPRFITNFKKLFADPMDSIISLHKIYCTPSRGSMQNIIIGHYYDTGLLSFTVTDQFKMVDCGRVTLLPIYDNVLDNAPYTSVQAYLPFCGIVNLNVNDIMNRQLHIWYMVDIITGACVCNVATVYPSGAEKILYMFNGNCLVECPITSANHSNIVRSLIGVGTAVATGGAMLGAAMGSINNAVSVSRSGNVSANVGAMSPRKPYLIISRKIPYDTDRNVLTEAYGENKPYSNLQSVVGTGVKVTVADFWPNSNDMESNELAKLRAILQTGIIIK